MLVRTGECHQCGECCRTVNLTVVRDVTVGVLRQVGLVDRDGGMVTMHRLVQEVIRSRLSPALNEEWTGRLLDLLEEALPDPNVVGMAVSAATSMAKFAASGFRRVDEPTHAVRMQRCSGCRHLEGSRCRLCGCFAQMKAWLPHEDCPVGKWPV